MCTIADLQVNFFIVILYTRYVFLHSVHLYRVFFCSVHLYRGLLYSVFLYSVLLYGVLLMLLSSVVCVRTCMRVCMRACVRAGVRVRVYGVLCHFRFVRTSLCVPGLWTLWWRLRRLSALTSKLESQVSHWSLSQYLHVLYDLWIFVRSVSNYTAPQTNSSLKCRALKSETAKDETAMDRTSYRHYVMAWPY